MNTKRRKVLVSISLILFVLFSLFGIEIYFVSPDYAWQFNRQLQTLAINKKLIGKTKEEVISVFGEPSSIYVYNDGDFSLNYFPGYFLPFSKFQAHFSSNGLLRETEMMDD